MCWQGCARFVARAPLARWVIRRVGAWLAVAAVSLAVQAAPLDIAINHGRVMDPETDLDAIRHVGIRDGRIVAISEQPLEAATLINAAQHVVAPGFIDIHSHTPTPLGQRLNVLDGITTQLDTEAGAYPVTAYGRAIKDQPLINFGASVGHFAARIQVIEGGNLPYIFDGKRIVTMGTPGWEQQATDTQLSAIRTSLEQGLMSGGLGIGVLLDYMKDAIDERELAMIFELAAQYNSPVFVHVRRGLPGDPAGLEEVLALAVSTGAPVFICHITHNAMGGIDQWLAKIDAAIARGARVTTETLSYLAGGTSISADVFRKRDWQRVFDISYEDVQWVATGEWLTKASWEYYAANEPNGAVNHHYVKEQWLQTALSWPGTMISTDALPAFTPEQLSNPNSAGTFSLVLGDYVRDKAYLTLMDALSRMSLKQAQWLEGVAPVFQQKGRLQLGMDADIVVFNPDTVAAKATYGDPYVPPIGIDWVIVNGKVVVDGGQIREGSAAGQRLLGAPHAP